VGGVEGGRVWAQDQMHLLFERSLRRALARLGRAQAGRARAGSACSRARDAQKLLRKRFLKPPGNAQPVRPPARGRGEGASKDVAARSLTPQAIGSSCWWELLF